MGIATPMPAPHSSCTFILIVLSRNVRRRSQMLSDSDSESKSWGAGGGMPLPSGIHATQPPARWLKRLRVGKWLNNADCLTSDTPNALVHCRISSVHMGRSPSSWYTVPANRHNMFARTSVHCNYDKGATCDACTLQRWLQSAGRVPGLGRARPHCVWRTPPGSGL